jgi:hypothetical protein
MGIPDVAGTKGAPLKQWNGAQSTEAGQGGLREGRLPPQEINRTSSSMFLRKAAEADGQPPGACSEMDESFSPVIFVYGMAFVLGVGKACTLLIWRTLPRSRPGLRQEVREAWQRWRQHKSVQDAAGHPPSNPNPQAPVHAPATQDGLPHP